MMKKCKGCGSNLQFKNPQLEGFIQEKNYEKSDLCERCFRIRNYGEYKKVEKTNQEFFPILDSIASTNDLVVLVIDLFNIPKNLEILKRLKNDILLVFTKRDIFPLSLQDEKLLEYISILGLHPVDQIIVSSNKNYHFDELIEKIRNYQKSKNVYVVGYTNAGKSTMMNHLIYNYSDLTDQITTSILPSTTLNQIEVTLDENLTLIDTPGILEDGNIMNLLDSKSLKKIIPRKEIKPITYQVKSHQWIVIDRLVIMESSLNNLTFFFSNELKIERYYHNKENNHLKENMIRVKKGQDIVISGLGFIKVMKDEVIKIKTLDKVDVYTRTSLI